MDFDIAIPVYTLPLYYTRNSAKEPRNFINVTFTDQTKAFDGVKHNLRSGFEKSLVQEQSIQQNAKCFYKKRPSRLSLQLGVESRAVPYLGIIISFIISLYASVFYFDGIEYQSISRPISRSIIQSVNQ